MSDTPTLDLTGKLLIAMPGMADPRFVKSVILVCAHSAEGAMGLIVNKPTGDITLHDLLAQLGIASTHPAHSAVHFGGPVEQGRGFVLHSPDYAAADTTLPVQPRIGLTATLDVLERIAAGTGPERVLVALGYAGWGPGQLEAELAENAWLTCDSMAELVFDADNPGKWQSALASMGIDALALSPEAGRA